MRTNKKSLLTEDPRVPLAAEWTFLAWIRTGLTLMPFGFAVARSGLFLRELAAVQKIPQPLSHGTSLWLLLVSLCGFPAAGEAAADRPAAASHAYARLPDDLPLDAVKWTGGYWQDRIRRLRSIYLPGVLDGSFMTLENGSTFQNLLRAAGKEKGGALGRSWGDGDCYLVLDSVARLYAYQPDDDLKVRLDYWIPIIARVQREDGVVDSWTVLGRFDETLGKPWQRLSGKEVAGGFQGALHYNMGSLHVAATTCFRATGDTRLLAVADRAVLNYMKSGAVVGPMQWVVSPLYARTGNESCLSALHRVYAKGSPFGPPLREALEIFGHNTQTAHHLLGATALCGLTGEPALLEALKRLASNQLTKKTYITGALAPVFHGERPEQAVNGKTYGTEKIHEAVGAAYELPFDSAYCESCGQCLYMEWYYRMFRLTGEAVYMDAAERALYNTIPGCVDLDRPNFFYCNPQEQALGSKRSRTDGTENTWESAYTWRRQYTKKAACCPPKVMRALALSAEVAYNVSREGLWVNLYGDNTVRVGLPGGGRLECRQVSGYPWEGKVRLEFQRVETHTPFGLFLRVPGWVSTPGRIAVNGQALAERPASGSYCRIQRLWKSGDVVEMELPMPVRRMAAHPNVADARGKVAVMRGPLVYCLEGDDVPEGVALERVCLPPAAELKPAFTSELGGVVKLTGALVDRAAAAPSAERLVGDPADAALYREARVATAGQALAAGDRSVTVSLIPYYARLNRKSDFFRIWLPVY